MKAKIGNAAVSAYRIETDFPESDGTLEWNATTVIVVELSAGDSRGLGYTYAHEGCVTVIEKALFPCVRNRDPMGTRAIWDDMCTTVRNYGATGLAACAIAAVDIAVWDLKARLLELSLAALLGLARDRVPVYGSGGFTSYPKELLCDQLQDWVKEGMFMVKIKVGREPQRDAERVQWAREAIGPATQLFVDANGAYTRKQALELAGLFHTQKVAWFEEPVSSQDLAGLNLLRNRCPGSMNIAAGEYNYHATQARRMLEAEAVDVLQVDATRCGGITGFLQMAALGEAFHIPLSTHTAPALHAHLGCSTRGTLHLEYFHDHARLEPMLFDGVSKPVKGHLAPDLERPGLGLEMKRQDITRFAI